MAPGPNTRKPQHKFIRTDSVAWTLFGPIWKCELRSILIFVWAMGDTLLQASMPYLNLIGHAFFKKCRTPNILMISAQPYTTSPKCP